jgi:hypothetical protein
LAVKAKRRLQCAGHRSRLGYSDAIEGQRWTSVLHQQAVPSEIVPAAFE